jgi:hypothetical protein
MIEMTVNTVPTTKDVKYEGLPLRRAIKIDRLTPESARKLIKEMVQDKGIELESLTQEKTLPEWTRFMINARLSATDHRVNSGHRRIYEGYDPVDALYAFKDPNGYAKQLQKRQSGNLSAPELLSFIPLKRYDMVESMNLKGKMEFLVEFAFEELLKEFPSLSIYNGKSGIKAVSAIKESNMPELIRRYKMDCAAYCRDHELKMHSDQLTPILYLFVPIR